MSHYFDAETTTGSDRARYDVALADVAFSIDTDRGVFSHGHLDIGTSLLLKEAPPLPPHGNLLDVGCGAGPIALAMALRSPDATVWAIDVNERARALTAHNCERANASNVRVCAPDDVPDDISFDTIWSNPPIRVGKQALHELLLTWLGRLSPSGTATLVVQKHLGADSLQRWLTGEGYPTERVASRKSFRLLHAAAAQG